MLGILLGIAVIILFLFLGSRNTIDEPSISGGATTQTQPRPAAKAVEAQAKAAVAFLTHEIGNAHRS